MFDRFGEFDSVVEINEKAAELKAAGNEEELVALALENGIDKEEAEDYMDECTEELVTPLMAALGKLKVEELDLKLDGVTVDWKEQIVEMCTEDFNMAVAVRKKGKSLAGCMAALIKFSFENKVQISDKIVNVTKVMHNGKLEQMRKPLYMGFPNKVQAKKIVQEYYLG